MGTQTFACGHKFEAGMPSDLTWPQSCDLCIACSAGGFARQELSEMVASSDRERFDQAISTSGSYTWLCPLGHSQYTTSLKEVLAGRRCKSCWHESNSGNVKPGIAFSSPGLRPYTSKAELDLRSRLGKLIATQSQAKAIRVATRVFGQLDVWPDIILPKLKVAIEYDDPGRNGLAHRGPQEESDRAKDAALREVGWEVIRVRVGGLEPIGPWDIVARGVTNEVVGRVIDTIRVIRGNALVDEQANRLIRD